MIGLALRYSEEMHHLILDVMMDGKKTAGRSRNSYTGQITKSLRNLKKKRANDQNGEMDL